MRRVSTPRLWRQPRTLRHSPAGESFSYRDVASADGPCSAVDITAGQQMFRYCTSFGGTVTLDHPGVFMAKNASAPSSCP
jgi:hypothetical protein